MTYGERAAGIWLNGLGMEGDRERIAAAIREAVDEEIAVVHALITGATGPTGGWILSPVQLKELIHALRLEEPR